MSGNSSSRGSKKQDPNLQINLKMSQRLEEEKTTTRGNTGKETKAGFGTFPRRALATPPRKGQGVKSCFPHEEESLGRGDKAGQEKAETGKRETYTQENIQSSPSLAVLWKKKKPPKIQQRPIAI